MQPRKTKRRRSILKYWMKKTEKDITGQFLTYEQSRTIKNQNDKSKSKI